MSYAKPQAARKGGQSGNSHLTHLTVNETWGVNSDSEGYHETITQCFIRAVRVYLARVDEELPLVEKVNGLLAPEEGKRDWPMCFYDPKTLFSRDPRLGWVEPDLARLPELTGGRR